MSQSNQKQQMKFSIPASLKEMSASYSLGQKNPHNKELSLQMDWFVKKLNLPGLK
jgi:hypothetical protein